MSGQSPESETEVPESVIQAACAGDQEAFGILFRRLYPRVFSTVRGMLGGDSDAHDVAQEAWLKAWNNRERFNFQSRYSTWIHRIAVNCSLDELRRRKRIRSRVTSFFKPNRGGSEAEVYDGLNSIPDTSAPNPSSQLENREMGESIRRAIDALPEQQRTVLVLREIEGYSYEEIAQSLGIKNGTVMSRLYHARKNLQANLGHPTS